MIAFLLCLILFLIGIATLLYYPVDVTKRQKRQPSTDRKETK